MKSKSQRSQYRNPPSWNGARVLLCLSAQQILQGTELPRAREPAAEELRAPHLLSAKRNRLTST